MQTINLGSACVGIVSKRYAVVGGLKRSDSELADHRQKVFKIDDHMGIAISGLAADARVLSKYMRNECLNHKFVYDTPMNTGRLVLQLADKHQKCTQSYVRRPYGVGLLVAGYDKKTGAHLYQTCPSGNYYEYKAVGMGARSQAAKTYLDRYYHANPEKGIEGMVDLDADELIKHALKALKGCVQGEKELDALNAVIGIVGADKEFTILEGADIAPYIELISEPADDAAGDDDAMDES